MSQKNLLRELKNTIKELTDDKDDLLAQLKSKESRIKQVLIQLEQSVDDVNHCGKKIREQSEVIKELKHKSEHEATPTDGKKENAPEPQDSEQE